MLTLAFCPMATQPMSLGRMRAVTSSVSSLGTISISGSPGTTDPPTVFLSTRLTRPLIGERSTDRSSRSASAGCEPRTAANSRLAEDNSFAAAERQSCRCCASEERASATLACARVILACAAATSARVELARLSACTSSIRGSIPSSTSGRISASSSCAARAALWRASSWARASSTARSACRMRASPAATRLDKLACRDW